MTSVLNTRVSAFETPGTTGIGASSVDLGSFIGSDPGMDHIWAEGQIIFNSCLSGTCLGFYVDGEDFMGVEFDISGTTHYGWINVRTLESGFGRLVDWAYETEPGVAIAAGAIPEPSVWFLLPLGFGLVVMRRRR